MSDGATIKYAALEPVKGSSEQPTVQLRWCGGKLQQKWLITDLLDWCPVAQRNEWRDVPTDDADAGFPTAAKDAGHG